jgi:hypothetical protein
VPGKHISAAGRCSVIASTGGRPGLRWLAFNAGRAGGPAARAVVGRWAGWTAKSPSEGFTVRQPVDFADLLVEGSGGDDAA